MSTYATEKDLMKCNQILTLVPQIKKDINKLQSFNELKSNKSLKIVNEGLSIMELWDKTERVVAVEELSIFQELLFKTIMFFGDFSNTEITLKNKEHNKKFHELVFGIGINIDKISKIAKSH